MSENRFLSFIITEGICSLVTGLSLLILPKVSSISFGFMLCLSCLFIGMYKALTSIMTRFFVKHYILDIICGCLLLTIGLIFLFAPIFDVMIIISMFGLYFVLKSISVLSLGIQTKNILNTNVFMYVIPILELLFGLMIIITIPTGALWFVGLIFGIDLVLYGFLLNGIYMTTKFYQE